MRHAFIFIFIHLAICCFSVNSQNLLVNGNFENAPSQTFRQSLGLGNINIPVDMTPPGQARAGMSLSEGVLLPTHGSSDYLPLPTSTANGWPIKRAHSGNGRIGLVLAGKNLRSREYITLQISEPLEMNRKYKFSLFIAQDISSDYTTTGVDVHFSNEAPILSSRGVLRLNPDLVLRTESNILAANQWVQLCGFYVATGDERFITLGNFTEENGTHVEEIFSDYKVHHKKQGWLHPMKRKGYYYMDDVLLEPMELLNDSCGWQPATQHGRQPENFVFLLDASASMNMEGKLPRFKSDLLSLSNQADLDHTISLVRFHDTGNTLISAISLQNKDTLSNVLSYLIAGGGSGIYNGMILAMAEAVKLSANGKPTRIIVFTDGFTSQNRQTLELLAQYKSSYPEIILHAIGIDKFNRKNLQRYVNTGGGQILNPGFEQFSDALHQLIGPKRIFSPCGSGELCSPTSAMQGFPPTNTIYVVDRSTSMAANNKLPKFTQWLQYASLQLRPEDKLSLIAFNTETQALLENTTYNDSTTLHNALRKLQAHGNTNINRAIKESEKFVPLNSRTNEIVNLVLVTDGKAEISKETKNYLKNLYTKGVHFWYFHMSETKNKKLESLCNKMNGHYINMNDSIRYQDFITPLQTMRMGEDYYEQTADYSKKRNKMIQDYRLSRILPFITTGAVAAYLLIMK
jgi:Mg-chelatase subunit ChlD